MAIVFMDGFDLYGPDAPAAWGEPVFGSSPLLKFACDAISHEIRREWWRR